MSIKRNLAALLAMCGFLPYAADRVSGQAARDISVQTNQKTHERKSEEARSHQVVPEKPKEQERPLEIVSFINDVRSAPPEFAADLLIRIAESKKIADLAWKRELIEEAFRLAPSAQQPVKRVALLSSPTDTRTGFLAQAFELKLDALSLQCRALNAMLAIDKKKARELAAELPKIQLQPLTCEDTLVYDVSDFFGTLKRIAERCFTSKEIERNEPLQFIESYIDQMASPVEIAPALELIGSFNTSKSGRTDLIQTFSNALGRLSGDDRSFTRTLYDVDRSIKNLIMQCLQQSVSRDELLRAYRTYLVRHFSGARCADNGLVLSKRMQSVISDFNSDLRLKGQRNILEISDDDLKPTRADGTASIQMHWQSAKSSALLTKIKKLRFGSGDKPLASDERDTLDWRASLDEFLKDLDDWKKEDEKTEEDYFHQKCVLLRGAIKLIPRKSLRDEVISKFVDFLNSFDLGRGSRIEWFWQANFLLKDNPYFDASSESGPSLVVRRADMLPIVERTKSPVLYLYAEAEKSFFASSPSK